MMSMASINGAILTLVTFVPAAGAHVGVMLPSTLSVAVAV